MLKGVMLGRKSACRLKTASRSGEYAKPTYSTAVAGRWKRVGTDFLSG
jgi:hypothetical protein